MPGSTTIVVPGEAASIAAWSESPSCTTTLAGAFAAEAAVVESRIARAVINEDRDIVDSFGMDCAPWCLSGVIARKRFDTRSAVAPPARDVLVGIPALAQREGCNPQRGAGRYAPSCNRYWQRRSVLYRIPSPSQSFFEMGPEHSVLLDIPLN